MAIASDDWCILGKGPTFAKRDSFALHEFRLLGLNHTVLTQHVFLGHAADVDVVEACGDIIEANCDWFLMPRRPHVRLGPTRDSIVELIDQIPVLRRLEEQGRLLYYNLSTAPTPPGERVVRTAAFSGVVALRLLADAGVRRVRSLGLDGGRSYSDEFSAFRDTTLLSNGSESYDDQLVELDEVAREHDVDYSPLFPPMRIFVGTDESQTIAAQVLEHSIRTHTRLPVDVRHMVNVDVPIPRDPANRPRTRFSFSRFLIPEACNYRGRALYLDADMLVFDDIGKLWDIEFGAHRVLCTSQREVPAHHVGYEHFRIGRQYSVMLLDCSHLDWDVQAIVRDLDDHALQYADLMFDLSIVAPEEIADRIPPEWNHLEHYEPELTALLHYTIVDTQPWKNDDNPLAPLWMDAYERAVADGAVDVDEVARLIEAGIVKEGLHAALARAPKPPRRRNPPVRLLSAVQREGVRIARGASRRVRARLRRGYYAR